MNASAVASADVYETAISNTMIAQMFNQSAQAEKGIPYTRKAIALLNKISDPEKKAELLFKIVHRLKWHSQDTKQTNSLETLRSIIANKCLK